MEYAQCAVVAREAGEGMLERLAWMTRQPQVILDVGCGVGETASILQERYPEATVIAIDMASSMLESAPPALQRVCASAQCLPLPDQTVDILFANFILPWQSDLPGTLREWKRVLRPDGILIFTVLGPDSFKEWTEALSAAQIPWQIDMHEVGDLLIEAGFADPVLDIDYCITSYRDPAQFVAELVASGICHSSIDVSMLPVAQDGCWETTYEIVYAHAFAPAPQDTYTAKDGVARIPLSHLRTKLNK